MTYHPLAMPDEPGNCHTENPDAGRKILRHRRAVSPAALLWQSQSQFAVSSCAGVICTDSPQPQALVSFGFLNTKPEERTPV
jgi:hypothetical protein